MAKYGAVSFEKIKDVKTLIERDLIESVPIYDNSAFEQLGFNVITDIENADVAYQFMAKSGTAEVYDPDNLSDHPLGYLIPRKLEVTMAVRRLKDNIQYYREKEPFSILGSNQTFQFPNTEQRLRWIMDAYRGDIIAPLFFGNKSLGKKNPMGLYDGTYTIIDQLINSGEISEGHFNYKKIDPMVKPTEIGEMYENFEVWVESWDPKLKGAERVLVYLPNTTKKQLIGDYMKVFTGFQSSVAGTNAFRFVGYDNIELVSSSLMGEPSAESGARMIATLPGNIDFGCDTESSDAAIGMMNDPADMNVIIYQIQTAQGVRIRSIASDAFCVSSGVNKPLEIANGSYYHDTITAFSNDKTMGKVVVSPEKTSYEKGESVTLTPTPESGAEFVKWADGATSNPRTIVFSGFPESYEAIFKKTENAG